MTKPKRPEDKVKTGRPSAYDPKYCADVIEYGKQGKSITWMCSEIGVMKSTLYGWIKEYPEFSNAINAARAHCQRWWEDIGQAGLPAGTMNATIWQKNMNCRFPDDWRDVTNINHGGQKDNPIEVKTVSDEELLKRFYKQQED